MYPLPYSGAERAAGLGRGSKIRYLTSSADPDIVDAEWRSDRLPALPGQVFAESAQPSSVIRIPPAAAQIETRTPHREPSLVADVAVPLLQALITTGAFGIMAGLVAWAAAWSWRVPVVVVGLALAISWLIRLRLMDRLLWQVERLTGADLNGDGVSGRPTTYAVANPAQARAAVASELRQADDQAKRAALLAFVDRCYISGCSERAHGVAASGPTRNAYIANRDTLLNLGLAEWKHAGARGGWRMCVSRQRAHQIIEKHVL